MIETVMVFALGFLAASLCALLVLPAVNARAARLARRRTEAMLPLSAGEIAAEKDFLRAEFAVRQRRLERSAEAAREGRHADMAALGSRTMEVARLAREVSARDGEIASGLETRGRLEADLGIAREDGSASLATLLALEEAHADLLDSLIAARGAGGGGIAAEAPAGRAEREAGSSPDADPAPEAIARENADLRRRITELADTLTRRDRLPAADAYSLHAQTH